jgi:shikimate dehydrogenase
MNSVSGPPTFLQVTGSTTLCAILADPIHHVRTPQAFNALMRQWNKDVLLVPVHVAPDQLRTVVDGLRHVRNLAGFSVTVPHKSMVLELCDIVSTRASAVGAVNVVRREADGRLVGEILDGIGFVAGLRHNGIEPRGLGVFMAGAGGAASAIAFGLAETGIASLTIWNRTRFKSEELRERLLRLYPELPVSIATDDPAGAELVLNATSLGLREDDHPPFNIEKLQAHQIVAEIIMQPVMTPLLLAARARGCRICLGAPMLDCQLAAMAEFMHISR